jgi:hypothetical protein
MQPHTFVPAWPPSVQLHPAAKRFRKQAKSATLSTGAVVEPSQLAYVGPSALDPPPTSVQMQDWPQAREAPMGRQR